MYKVNDTVIYPIYGCGKILKIYKERINNVDEEYYELEFPETNISISIPVKNAPELGLRDPMKKEDIKLSLKNLWKKVKPVKDEIIDLEVVSRDLLNSGKIDDAIVLINMIKASERSKSEFNKALSFSDEHNLEIAVNFVRSEVEHCLGKKVTKEFKLNED